MVVVVYFKWFDYGWLVVMVIIVVLLEGGWIFYNVDMSGFNFCCEQIFLCVVLDILFKYLFDFVLLLIYVVLIMLDIFLFGFVVDNLLVLGVDDLLVSIWIGNCLCIVVYQDVFDNLVCVVVGCCCVILFLFDQVDNFYIGLLDFIFVGQVVSLVDFVVLDLGCFLCFVDVMVYVQVVELVLGDVVYIFLLWWYYMEGLDVFNVLVNSWWWFVLVWMDVLMNVLMLVLLVVCLLLLVQCVYWCVLFDYYVFDVDEVMIVYILVVVCGVFGEFDLVIVEVVCNVLCCCLECQLCFRCCLLFVLGLVLFYLYWQGICDNLCCDLFVVWGQSCVFDCFIVVVFFVIWVGVVFVGFYVMNVFVVYLFEFW